MKNLSALLFLALLVNAGKALAQNTCATAVNINSVPFSGLQQATLGTGSDYSGCATTAYAGEDFVYALNITNAPVSLNVTFITSGNFGTMGVSFYDNCPTSSGNCIAPFLQLSNSGTATRQLNITTNGTYYIIIDNISASYSGNFSLSISQTPLPACPSLGSPANNLVTTNNTPTLTWASVSTAISYDVYVGSSVATATLQANVTTNFYTFPTALSVGTYYWYIVPRNLNGAQTSCSVNARAFTVINPVVNDDCAGAITAIHDADTVWNTVSTIGATQSMPPCAASTTTYSDDDVWYKFTATDSVMFLSIRNTPFAATFPSIRYEVFSGSCGSLSSMGCGLQHLLSFSFPMFSSLVVNQTYYIRFYTEANQSYETFDFCLLGTPSYLTCYAAPLLTNKDSYIDTVLRGSTNFDNFQPAFSYTVSNACASGTVASDKMLFKFVATDTQQVISFYSNPYICPFVPTCLPANFDYQFLEGTCSGLTPVTIPCPSCFCNTFNAAGTQFITTPKLVIGNTYYLRVWTRSNIRVDFAVGIGTIPLPPTNDSCINAITITPVANEAACTGVLANTAGAKVETPGCAAANDDDIWYKFTATSSNMAVKYSGLQTDLGATHSLGMALYSGSCSALTQVSGSCTSAFGSGGTGKRVVSGLTIGNTYYLQLFTTGATGYGRFNLCVYDTMMVPPACTSLLLPVNNDVNISITPTLTWNAAIGASAYDVYLGTSVGTATLVGSSSSTSFSASGLSYGTVYYWYVVPKNVHGSAVGCSSGAWSFTTLPLPLPSCTPLQLPVNNDVNISISPAFSWDAVTAATGYDVYLGTSVGTAALVGSPVSNSFNASGLSYSTTYYWYVVPKSIFGAAIGCNAGAWSFTTDDPPPPGNDSAAGAYGLIVGNIPTGYTFTNKYATQGNNEPFASCIKTAGHGTVWYKFLAPASGFVRLHLSSSTSASGAGALPDVACALYAATDSSDYNTFTNITCAYSDHTDFDRYLFAAELTPGAAYYIQVDGFAQASQGDFNIAVEDVTTAMLSAGSSCVEDTTIRQVRNDYTGWLSLTDIDKLHAMVKKVHTAHDMTGYVVAQYVNGLPVRNFNGVSYLDRNYFIHTLSPVGPADVRLFFNDSDLVRLYAVDPSATLAALKVTQQSGTDCNEHADASGTRQLLAPAATAQANGIDWVTFRVSDFSNFYLHAGTERLSVTSAGHQHLSVYPNPVQDVLYLSVSQAAPAATLTLSDVTGKQHVSQQVTSGVNSIRVSSLAPGIYFLKYMDGENINVTKIIKE